MIVTRQKLLHLNGHLEHGGVEQYLGQVTSEFEKLGIENVVIYGEPGSSSTLSERIKTYYIPGINRIKCENENNKISEIRKIISSENPDLIFFHQINNWRIVKSCATERPNIKFVHDFKLICPDGAKTLKSKSKVCFNPVKWKCQLNSYFFQCMPRNFFRGLPLIKNSKMLLQVHKEKSYLMVASNFMKSMLVLNGFKKDKICVNPYFIKFPENLSLIANNNHPLILTVGRIVNDKGIHYLIRALPKINKNAKLVVIGDGPALNDLKGLAKKLSVDSRVSFIGRLQHKYLEKQFRQSTLVVVPSIWPEPFGIVGIEAMSYGKPVVGFNLGGIPEWLENEKNGFLVEPRNVKDLSKKINRLLGSPFLADRMGKKARQMVKDRFLNRNHTNIAIKLFDKIICKPN